MTVTPLQAALGQAQLQLAAQFGIGGRSWRVVGGTQTVTGYVRAVPPWTAPSDLSNLGYTTNTDYLWLSKRSALPHVAQGVTLESTKDPSIRVVIIGAPNTDRGIVEASCERVSA